MSTLLVIGTIAAVPASAGGRADSEPSAGLRGTEMASMVAPSLGVLGDTPSADPPADRTPEVNYWHRLAVKRLKLLGQRERRIVGLMRRLQVAGHSESTSPRPSRRQPGGVRGVICKVFGAHCSEALRVAWCESRFNIYARNGQYLGLFQEGEFARSKYGFAWNAWTQARSAYRYFLDAGWGPWQCRP